METLLPRQTTVFDKRDLTQQDVRRMAGR